MSAARETNAVAVERRSPMHAHGSGSGATTAATAPTLVLSRRCAPPAPFNVIFWVCAGAILRLALLDVRWLNLDEAESFRAAAISPDLLAAHGTDPHPLTYYLILRLLPDSLLQSAAMLRLPSALFSIAALALWPMCLRSIGVRGSLRVWCVAALALWPLDVRYSHEARAYALIHLAGVAALTAYAAARRRPRPLRLGLLALCTAASAHVDVFGLVVPAALTLCQLPRLARRRASRALFAALTCGFLLAAPYNIWRASLLAGDADDLSHLPADANFIWLLFATIFSLGPARLPVPFDWGDIDLARRAAAIALIGLALWTVIRRPVWSTRRSAELPLAAGGGAIATTLSNRIKSVLSLAILAAGALLAARRRSLTEFLWIAALPGVGIVALIAGVLFFGMTAGALQPRYLIPAIPALVVLHTFGACWLGRRAPWIAAALVIAAPLLANVGEALYPAEPIDTRSPAGVVLEGYVPGDLIVTVGPLHDYYMYRLGPLLTQARQRGVAIDPQCLREVALPSDEEHPQLDPEVVAALAADARTGRIWFVTDGTAYCRIPDLSARAVLEQQWSFKGSAVALWRVRP